MAEDTRACARAGGIYDGGGNGKGDGGAAPGAGERAAEDGGRSVAVAPRPTDDGGRAAEDKASASLLLLALGVRGVPRADPRRAAGGGEWCLRATHGENCRVLPETRSGLKRTARPPSDAVVEADAAGAAGGGDDGGGSTEAALRRSKIELTCRVTS